MRRSAGRCNSSRNVGRSLALALACAAALAAPAPVRADKADRDAKEQLSFGVDMARRGLWNEALFRFEQLRKVKPRDAAVLNNLGVAYEAVGRFEDAETAYSEAMEVAPGNRDIRKNVTRFREFLQSYRIQRPSTEIPAEKPAEPTAPPPGHGGSR